MIRPPGTPLLLTIALLLSGCASPSPDMMQGIRHSVTVEGVDFVVFHKESEAQVIRMGYLGRKDRDRVHALMVMAVVHATGCRVIPNSMKTAISGDTGVARFDLDCR